MTPARAALARSAVVAAGVVLAAHPAHAHMNSNLGDLYQGLFQPFFHPECLCGALAVALWSTQQEGRNAYLTCGVFALAVAIGAVAALAGMGGPSSQWGPRLSMLGIGPLVAARVRPPFAAVAVGVALSGLAQGHTATASEIELVSQPLLWTLGLALGAGLLGVYANLATDRFRAFWMQVAVRVVGSWIAAIGLMVSVLAARVR